MESFKLWTLRLVAMVFEETSHSLEDFLWKIRRSWVMWVGDGEPRAHQPFRRFILCFFLARDRSVTSFFVLVWYGDSQHF